MIAMVDYGRGNLFSLSQALRHLGAEPVVTSDPRVLADAERIILPGVGAFGDAMKALNATGLVAPLRMAAEQGKPILGICLGMQMLADGSEEFGDHQGLGLIPCQVRRLPAGADRIPNVGWRALDPRPGNFLADMTPRTMVYFVHSFAPQPEAQSDVAATIRFNGAEIAVAIRRGNVVGYQFHPEKSGPAGLDLIRRFLEIA